MTPYRASPTRKRKVRRPIPAEFKLVATRKCPLPAHMRKVDSSDDAAAYWRAHIANHPFLDSLTESLFVLLLDSHFHVMGHTLVSKGTVNGTAWHPREVFRPALIGGATSVVLMHNHPSGVSTPSAADIAATKELHAAGEILGIPLVDHVIMGRSQHSSLLDLNHLRVAKNEKAAFEIDGLARSTSLGA